MNASCWNPAGFAVTGRLNLPRGIAGNMTLGPAAALLLTPLPPRGNRQANKGLTIWAHDMLWASGRFT